MANRYWVGGTGTWNSTNTAVWSSSAGGLPGATVPTAADAVIINTGSGTGTCTIAAGYNPTIGSLTFTPSNFTLDINNNNVTCRTYSNDVGPTGTSVNRVIAFGATGQITVTGNNGIVCAWRYEYGLTFTGSKKFVLSYAGNVGTRSFTFVSYNSVNALPNIYITAGSDIIAGNGASGWVSGDCNFTGFSGKLTPNQWFLYGSLILSPTMTLTGAPLGGLNTVASSGNHTISNNGAPWSTASITFGYPTITSSTAVYTFTDANLTLPTTTFNVGTLDFSVANANVTFASSFTSTSGRGRTIRWGTGTYTCSALNATLIDMSNLNGFTGVGTPTIMLSGLGAAGQTRTVNCGTVSGAANKTIGILVPAGADSISLNGFFANVTFGSSFTGSLTSTAARIISGNLTVVNSMVTANNTNTLTFAPNSANNFITTAGITVNSPVIINGSSNTVVLNDNLTLGANYGLTLSQGTLNGNGKTLSIDSFTSTSALARVLNQNGSTINIVGSNKAVCNISSTGWSSTGATTFDINYAGSDGTRTITVASNSPLNINVPSGGDNVALTGVLTNLNFTGFAGNLLNGTRTLYGNLTYSNAMIAQEGNASTTMAAASNAFLTTNGIAIGFPLAMTSTGQVHFVDNYNGNKLSTNTTLTLTSANVNFGNANVDVWSTTISASGNSNLVINNGNLNITGTTGNVAQILSSTFLRRTEGFKFNLTGNAATTDTRQVKFPASLSTTQSFGVTVANGAGNLAFTASSAMSNLIIQDGFTGNLNGSNAITLHGNLTLGNNVSVVTPTANITFFNDVANTVQYISSNSVANLGMGVNANTVGDLTFLNDISVGALTLTKGNINLNDYSINALSFVSSASVNTRALNFGNANLNLYGANTTILYVTSQLNLSFSGSKVVVATAAASANRSFLTPLSSPESSALSLYVPNTPDQLNISGAMKDLVIGNLTANSWYDGLKNIYGNFIVVAPPKVQPAIVNPSVTTMMGANTTQILSIDAPGINLGSSYTVNAPGSNVVFDYDLYADTLTLTNGNLVNANAAKIIANVVELNGSNTRSLTMTNANVDVMGSGTVWYAPTSTDLTLALSNSTINLFNTGVMTFVPGEGMTYPPVVINSSTPNSITSFYGNVTYTSLAANVSTDFTVKFDPGTVNEFDQWSLSGSNAYKMTLTSLSFKGSIGPHNLVFNGNTLINVSNVDISYSHASPNNTWYSLLTNDNVDGGDNAGWIFSTAPPPSGQNSSYHLLWW